MILVDIDGVLCESEPALRRIAEDLFGLDLPNPTRTWNLRNLLSRGQLSHVLREFPSRILELEPVPGAIEGVRSLRETDKVLFLTSREFNRSGPTTYEWLNQHGLGDIPVVFSDNKIRAAKLIEKSGEDMVRAIVEDRASAAVQFSEEGYLAILLDRPWNRMVFSGDCLVRAYDWSDVVDAILMDLGGREMAGT